MRKYLLYQWFLSAVASLLFVSCEADNTYETQTLKASVVIKSTSVTLVDKQISFTSLGSNKAISGILYEVVTVDKKETENKISDLIPADKVLSFDITGFIKNKKVGDEIGIKIKGKFADGTGFNYPYSLKVVSSVSTSFSGDSDITYQKKTADTLYVKVGAKQSDLEIKEAFVEWKKNKGGTYAADSNFLLNKEKLQKGESNSIRFGSFTKATYSYGLSIGDKLYYRFNIENSVGNVEQYELEIPVVTQSLDKTQGSTSGSATLDANSPNFILRGGIATKDVAKAEILFDNTLPGFRAGNAGATLKFVEVDLAANNDADKKIFESSDILRAKALIDVASATVTEITVIKDKVYAYKIERTLPSLKGKIVAKDTKDAVDAKFTLYGLMKMGDVSSLNGTVNKVSFNYMEGVLDL